MEAKKIINKSTKQLQFIGSTFHKEGFGVLTVTDSYKKGNNTLFSVHCSVCSCDQELFPENEMLISKNNLNQNKYPCKCSSGWKPSNYQYKVMVVRFAKDNGDEILSFNDNNTIIKVRTKDYKDWSVLSKDYLNGKRSLDEAMSNKINNLRSPDSTHINRFMGSGAFIDGTKFWRSDKRDSRGYYPYWNYTCPVCSNDEYVTEGLCDGIFTGITGTLSVGNKSCRCAQNYRWAKNQKEYQLKKILMKEGAHFVGWTDGYNGAFSKFDWVCNKGHTCSTGTSNFIHMNQRCKTCAENDWGLYKHKSEDEDTLYLLKFKSSEECFYKVGRTFKTKDRFSYFRGFYGVDILNTITDTHRTILDKERYLKQLLTSEGYHYTPHTSFDGHQEECFTSGILSHPEIISIFNLKEHQNDNTHNSN